AAKRMKVSTVIAPLLSRKHLFVPGGIPLAKLATEEFLSRKHLFVPGHCFCQPVLYSDLRLKADEAPGQIYVSAMASHVARAAGLIKDWNFMIGDLKDRSHQMVDRKLPPRGDVEDLPSSGWLLVDAHGSVGYLAHEDEIARLLSIAIDGHRLPS